MNKKIIGILLMVLCTLFIASGQYFLKQGTNNLSIIYPDLLLNFPLLIGLFLYALGSVLLIVALKFGNLNELYPVLSITFVWVTLLSYLSLHESISNNQLIGISFVLLGVFVINKEDKK